MLESNLMYKGFYNDPGLVLAMDFEGTAQTFVDQQAPPRTFGRYGSAADVDLNVSQAKNGTRSLRQGQVSAGASGLLYAAMLSSDLIFSGDFWIETWGYCQGQGNSNFTGNNNTIFSWGQYAVAGGMSRFLLNALRTGFTVANGTGESTLLIGNITVTNNAWHHHAVGRSGNTLYLFTNGALAGSVSYTGVIGFGTQAYIAGYSDSRISGATYAGFNGYLDRLRIYNRCLYTSAFTPSTALFGKKQ